MLFNETFKCFGLFLRRLFSELIKLLAIGKPVLSIEKQKSGQLMPYMQIHLTRLGFEGSQKNVISRIDNILSGEETIELHPNIFEQLLIFREAFDKLDYIEGNKSE